MSLMQFSVKHNRSTDEAKARLGLAIEEARRLYGPLIQQIAWAPDRSQVTVRASGLVAEMRVDSEHVHATIDVPLLGGLLGNRMAGALQQIVQKQLSGPGASS